MSETGAQILVIGPASRQDLDRLLAIEQESFSSPWTRKMFEAELEGNPFGSLLTARLRTPDGELQPVIGYICFWVVFEELRVMNLGVEPSARRRGIGTKLVRHALGVGAEWGAGRALLEVRASNSAAVGLYEHIGFRVVGRRLRYYTNPIEDAMLMEMDLSLYGAASGSRRAEHMLTESRIAELLRESNPEFRALEESHHKLDAELSELHKQHVLTPQEEILKKQIQKEKLAKKDRMAELIRQYRQTHDRTAPTERVGT
jgi:ribosomal-protein-alanine N-acetyltransferase